MKAKEPSFYEQYVGKQIRQSLLCQKMAETVSRSMLSSGATITSRAVTGAVNAALGYYQNAFGQGGS